MLEALLAQRLGRREFLRGTLGTTAAFATVDTQKILDLLASPESATNSIGYGLTVAETGASRKPEEPLFASYKPGTLIRYENADPESKWIRVIHDAYRSFPDQARAHGEIYIPRASLREIRFEELSPISPDIPPEQKRIEIILSLPQRLIAYEGDNPVFETMVSAGKAYPTPVGIFHLFRERWARHMQGVDNGKVWDLPGVPFVMYFTWQGHAIHGTYWHNNFGEPMSHGCVNVPNDAAEWLFRWTTPVMPDFQTEELLIQGGDPAYHQVTHIEIHY